MKLELTRPQLQFFKLQCRYPLFIAGYGSGKTEALISTATCDLLGNPGAKIGVYVPIYDQIRLNIAPRFMEMFRKVGISSRYDKTDKVITTDYGEIIMRSMDNPATIVGYEVFRSHCDEMETMLAHRIEDAWFRIIARNRQKIGNALNQVRVYTTPDAGFGFTYRQWGKSDDPDYQYVRAPTYSNPFLPDDYVSSLRKTYSADLAEAFIEGQWCNINSGSVYPQFDRARNNSTETIRGREPLLVGMDFNVQRGCAVIFVRRDETIHAVDEIYNAFDTNEQIKILKERYPDNPITIYPDATGKNRRSANATETDFSQLKLAGYRIKVDHSNPPIKERVQSCNAGFLNGEGETRVYVNTQTCPHYTDALEQQAYDPNGLPDKSPPNWDDINDAGGYVICKIFPITRKSATIKVIQGGH